MATRLDLQNSNVTLNSLNKTSLNQLPASEGVFIPVKNAILFCRIIGEGRPIVVAHGGPGLTHKGLLPGLAELSRHYQMIFFDQRGCGQSTGELDEDSMQIATSVEDMEEIRKALGLERISIIGHSWGGLLAMKYAVDHQESVDKLILLDSLPAAYQHNPSNPNPYLDGIKAIKSSDGYKTGNVDMISQSYKDLFSTFCYNPEKGNEIDLEFPTKEAALKSILIREEFEKNLFSQSYDYQKDVAKLYVPTLLIHGENDPLPVAISQSLHHLISSSEQPVILKECGHFPNVEQPVALVEQLEKFLK